MKLKTACKLAIFVGSIALGAAAAIAISPYLNRISRTIFKKHNKVEQAELDELGPEIVPKQK